LPVLCYRIQFADQNRTEAQLSNVLDSFTSWVAGTADRVCRFQGSHFVTDMLARP
jgi:hypothetical protein